MSIPLEMTKEIISKLFKKYGFAIIISFMGIHLHGQAYKWHPFWHHKSILAKKMSSEMSITQAVTARWFMIFGIFLGASCNLGILSQEFKKNNAHKKVNKKLKSFTQRYCEIAPGVNMSFCACPEGRFRMGYMPSFIERWLGWQKPLDVVSDGFWMSKYMVTQGQWKAIMGSYTVDDAEDSQSVFFVSWYEACQFIEKANKYLHVNYGMKMDMPTEAEWEYAAISGLSSNKKNDNFKENLLHEKSKDTGRNDWGIHYIIDYCREWCSDWYSREISGGINPKGPANGSFKLCRSTYNVTHRHNVNPRIVASNIGFRVTLKSF